MKSLWNSFKIAFSMFSKIPMPQADWTEENMKYMFVWFPWIGAVIGGATMLVAYVGNYFGFRSEFINIILLLIPIFVTGGIHVDGLLDTADAMSSWQERKRRLEILKDSHAGAFAVITAGIYFLLLYAGYSQIDGNSQILLLVSMGFMVSRSFSGIGVLTLPKAKEDGTVAEFSRKSSEKRVKNVLLVYLVLLAVGMFYVDVVLGIATIVTAGLVFGYYRHFALKNFGGTTGDLSGFFLCLCEASIVLVLAVVSNFVGV